MSRFRTQVTQEEVLQRAQLDPQHFTERVIGHAVTADLLLRENSDDGRITPNPNVVGGIISRGKGYWDMFSLETPRDLQDLLEQDILNRGEHA